MSTRCSLLALALLAPVFPLTAPAADTVPGIAELAERWGGECTEGRFIEKRRIAGFPKPLVSEGRFSVVRQQGARWITEKPFPSTLVLDAAGMHYESASSSSEVSSGSVPAVGRLGDFMQGVFAGDLKMLAGVFDLSVSGSDPVTVTALPKAGGIDSISRIEITGRRSVEKILIVSASGDVTELELIDVVRH